MKQEERKKKMFETTQHQIVTEPTAFMSALIWLYLCLRPAETEIKVVTPSDQIPDGETHTAWMYDRMEDRF